MARRLGCPHAWERAVAKQGRPMPELSSLLDRDAGCLLLRRYNAHCNTATVRHNTSHMYFHSPLGVRFLPTHVQWQGQLSLLTGLLASCRVSHHIPAQACTLSYQQTTAHASTLPRRVSHHHAPINVAAHNRFNGAVPTCKRGCGSCVPPHFHFRVQPPPWGLSKPSQGYACA
jgi:hypothetical protein